MSFSSFARSKAALIVIWVIGVACLCGIAAATGAARDAVVLMAVIGVVAGTVALAIDYARYRRFLSQACYAQTMEHAWQVPDLIDEPKAGEMLPAYDAMQAMKRSAAADIEDERQKSSDYHTYIEAWVHEIKAPLAAAQLAASGIEGDDGERLRSELDDVERQVEQALWYARSMSVSSDYKIREVNLQDLVNAACRKNARFMIDHGVAPQVNMPEQTTVFTDDKWTAFIMTQTVVNSVKYGASKIVFSSERISLPDVGEAAILTISDNGIGIPAADVPRVFERGFTGENGRAKGSSTGMGLYLAAVMCRKMGLGIEIASERGSGTRIILTFPQDRSRLDLSNLTGL